jgi:hypothetical protein
MNTIDFSHVGGFPLTQTELDFMQQTYLKGIHALAQMSNNAELPVIISGMHSTSGRIGTVTVSDGWLYYRGQMVQFTGGTVTYADTDIPMVEISLHSVLLTYQDGVERPALKVVTAHLMSGPTRLDDTHFPLHRMRSFHEGFGAAGREQDWNVLDVGSTHAAGSISGSVYYQLDKMNNSLHLRGMVFANDAQSLNSSTSGVLTLIATLPEGYRPAVNTYFTAYNQSPRNIKDDAGVAWIKQINALLHSSGNLQFNFMRPEATVAELGFTFNVIIPLG